MEAGEITLLLRAYDEGDRSAFDRMVPLVYDELRRLARRHIRRGPRGQTLNTTGLVHEAYLKLAGSPELRLRDRGHLMAVTACAMRQVMVSRARARLADKRGGGVAPVELEEGQVGMEPAAEWLIDLDRALAGLRDHDERLAQVFECRYFAGLSEEETAEALGTSLRTVQRGWMRARAWLRDALQSGARDPEA
ncbi:MAG: ECF-type sigma factor [Planctomycetota bacterium]|jgi:RNA polymerase sigma factor (TIGR02999 family)